jgi:hypothetical protein
MMSLSRLSVNDICHAISSLESPLLPYLHPVQPAAHTWQVERDKEVSGSGNLAHGGELSHNLDAVPSLTLFGPLDLHRSVCAVVSCRLFRSHHKLPRLAPRVLALIRSLKTDFGCFETSTAVRHRRAALGAVTSDTAVCAGLGVADLRSMIGAGSESEHGESQ